MPRGRASIPNGAQRRPETQTATTIFSCGAEAHIKIKAIALAVQTYPPEIS